MRSLSVLFSVFLISQSFPVFATKVGTGGVFKVGAGGVSKVRAGGVSKVGAGGVFFIPNNPIVKYIKI